MSVDANAERRERNEKLSLRIVGICFAALAVYIEYEAMSDQAIREKQSHKRYLEALLAAEVEEREGHAVARRLTDSWAAMDPSPRTKI